jgi:glutamyl-tRNA synthetase
MREKLDWFNHQHLLRLDDAELIARLMPLLDAAGYLTNDLSWLARILALLRPRAKTLTDFVEQITPFFVEPAAYDQEGVKKHLSAAGSQEHILALKAVLATVDWEPAALEKALRDLAEARTVKAAMLIHGTRLALTGRMVSPGLFEMLVLIGRESALRRLQKIAAVIP